MGQFRFQDLRIWQLAMGISLELYDIADMLDQKKHYRVAEQLRAAGLSMSNNIAEGCGSNSNKEFAYFLNVSRRSTFENANILILLEKRNLISSDCLESLLSRLESLCRQIQSMSNALNKG